MTIPSKRVVSLGLSALVLVGLYWIVDFEAVVSTLAMSHWKGVVFAMTIWIPVIAMMAIRFQTLAPLALPFAQSVRLILRASTLNMVLPAKMGDFAKGYFLHKEQQASAATCVAIVVLEKSLDLFGIMAISIFGLALSPALRHRYDWVLAVMVLGAGICMTVLFSRRILRVGASVAMRGGNRYRLRIKKSYRSFRLVQRYIRRHPSKTIGVLGLTVAISFGNFVQFYWLATALGVAIPLISIMALVPIAVLAALIPFGFAGIGTRDVALVVLFGTQIGDVTAAAWGVLATARYLVPAVVGLPLMLQGAADSTWRAASES